MRKAPEMGILDAGRAECSEIGLNPIEGLDRKRGLVAIQADSRDPRQIVQIFAFHPARAARRWRDHRRNLGCLGAPTSGCQVC